MSEDSNKAYFLNAAELGMGLASILTSAPLPEGVTWAEVYERLPAGQKRAVVEAGLYAISHVLSRAGFKIERESVQ